MMEFVHACPTIMCRCWPSVEWTVANQHLYKGDPQVVMDAWAEHVRQEQESCHHWWYRSAAAPPDHCTLCGAEKDNG